MWLRGIAIIAILQISLSTAYVQCPKSCQCSSRLMICSSFDFEKPKFEVPNLKVSSKTPITLTNGIFKQMNLDSINMLHFENTTITTIEPNAFDGLIGLTSLFFIGCNAPSLKNINTTSISPTLKKLIIMRSNITGYENLALENLEELDIVNSGVKEIPEDAFSNMPDLSFINFAHNEIKTFNAKTFINLHGLMELQLSDNNITTIPDGIFSDDTDISSLDLSNNPITKVEIKSPSRIEELILKSCKIEKFTGGEYLSMVSNLDLSRNAISDIAVDTFTSMQFLEYLDLSNNDLETLNPDLFKNNSRMLRLRLDNNELKAIPKFTTVDGHFQTFYFSCDNCMLENIDDNVFDSFPGVVTLSLSNNNLKSIKENVFKNLNALIELDLSYNQISSFKPGTFDHNPVLTVLNLAGNTFSSIDTSLFTKNKGLKNLDLSNGQLTKLWEEPTKELPALRILNVANNKNMKSITQKDLEVAKNLNVLDVSDVDLDCGSDFKSAIKWLKKHDVAPAASMRKTHESMEMFNYDKSWDNLEQTFCPNDDYYDDSGYDDVDNNVDEKTSSPAIDGNYLDEDDQDDDDDDEAFSTSGGSDIYDDSYRLDAKLFEDLQMQTTTTKAHSFLWPTVVFLSTSLIVLIVCSVISLLCLKKRTSSPNITLSHVQILPWSSGPTIKKHSGSVYRPLSEEKFEPATPKFRRYEQVPTIHTA